MATPLYPLFLRLTGRRVLVVGGGDVATRRVRRLLACGALVTVHSPGVTQELRELSEAGRLLWIRSPWDGNFQDGYTLCIAATSDERVNLAVIEAAELAEVTSVNAGESSSSAAVIPAVVQRDPVAIAITSSGASPALTSLVRDRIESVLGDEVSELARILGRLRSVVGERQTQRERAELYRAIATPANLALLESGDRTGLLERIRREASARGFGEIEID